MTSIPGGRVLLVVSLLGALLAGCSSSKAKTDADFCALAKSQETQTASFTEEFTTDRPDQLKPVVDKALVELKQFDDARPPAISDAAHTYVTDETSFLNVIKNNGYDVSKSLAVVEKAADDSAFVKAGQALTAYLVKTCHLGPPASASATPSPTGG